MKIRNYLKFQFKLTVIKNIYLVILLLLLPVNLFAIDNENTEDCYYSNIQKVFLHLNKDAYISGEDILFKGYLVSGNNIPDTLCQMLYIELQSPSNQKIISFSVNLFNGTCNSYFTIPDTLPTGYYFVKAFTNQMRNFDHINYFSSKIIIANQADDRLEKLITENYHNYDSAKIIFRPESGDMIVGIENEIVFYITDFNDEWQNIPIQIIDDSAQIITSITPDKRGFGEFSFTPIKSKKYVAQWNKKKFNFLPSVTNGSKIHAQYSDGFINVEVRNTIEGTSDIFKIGAYNNGKKVFEKEFSTNNGFASLKIPTNTIANGLTEISLFNSNVILAQQSIYLSKEKEEGINLYIDKTNYSCRQKVKVTVSLNNNKLKDKCNLSLSVSQKMPTSNPIYYNTVDNYFNLLSSIGNNMLRVMETDFLSNNQINEILAVNKPFLKKTNKTCMFLPENRGFIISGHVLNKANMPVPNVWVYLSVADSFASLKYCISDSAGRFFFKLSRFYDNKNFIFQAKSNNNEIIKIELEDKYNGELPKHTGIEYINPTLKNYLKNAQNISLSNKIYKPSNLLLLQSENQFNPDLYNCHFYGFPDVSTYMSDYDELDDFKEIVRNIMPGVYYNRSENKVRVIDRGTQTLWPNEALVLLNNIPFPDPAFVAKLGSKQIKKIDLKKNHLIYGNLDIYGILSITTNQKNVYALNSAYANTTYPNIVRNIPVIINGPDYALKNSQNMPDFRPTLYWDPEVKLTPDGSATIEFYTSDLKGNFVIELEGVSSNGIPISASKTIEVK